MQSRDERGFTVRVVTKQPFSVKPKQPQIFSLLIVDRADHIISVSELLATSRAFRESDPHFHFGLQQAQHFHQPFH